MTAHDTKATARAHMAANTMKNYQHDENDDSPMRFFWFQSQRPPPAHFKTMKIMTVLCISYDSGARRTPPAHFRNHENGDRPMHFI